MKRKEKEVPGFDEIIFENRNKEYGAYYLRKHYDSTTSISILGGVAFCTFLTVALSLSTEKGIAIESYADPVFELTNPIIPDPVRPELKPPAELTRLTKNLVPVVTSDTTLNLPSPPITDVLVETTLNGNVEDSVVYQETDESVLPAEREPVVVVKEMPEFPGGIPALMKFISDNISYPQDAVNNNIQGKVVLKFVVKSDGSIGRIELLGGIDSSLDNEAIRVIKSLPLFRPGKDKGVPVPVWFTIPVIFRLENK